MKAPLATRRLIWLSLFILVLVSSFGCVENTERPSIGASVERLVEDGARVVDFGAQAKFGWDRMYVFQPYSSRESVERTLGYNWPEFVRTRIESSDSVCLVLFALDREVVGWYEQERAVDLVELANQEGYPRTKAKFRVERLEGRHVLRRLGEQ